MTTIAISDMRSSERAVIEGMRRLASPASSFRCAPPPLFSSALFRFLHTIDGCARRALLLLPQGAERAAIDECALVNFIAAAKEKNDAHAIARASWLVRADAVDRAIAVARETAIAIEAADLFLSPPRCRRPSHSGAQLRLVAATAGQTGEAAPGAINVSATRRETAGHPL
ncbi:MAG: hypothetical protein AAGJ87_00615 [Pseudomonadota bacterium]